MGKQTAKQIARREAREAQRRLLGERQERERRLGDLGVQVAEALGRRDALLREREVAVRAQELKAGEALRKMTEEERLPLSMAAQWCGDGVSAREAGRLRRLASDAASPGQGQSSEPATTDQGATSSGPVVAEPEPVPAAGMMG